MKVECISRSGAQLPPDLVRPELGYGRESTFPLVVGRQYVVYGFTVYLGHVWYYLCDEEHRDYPVWRPSPLFRVTDGRVSSHWHLGYHVLTGQPPIPVMAFREWAEDPLFYERLTDGDPAAVAAFQRYKVLLDEEAGGVLTPGT